MAKEAIANLREKHGNEIENGPASQRLADLFANERSLLHQQNEELKKICAILRETDPDDLPNSDSALRYYGTESERQPRVAASKGRLTLEEAIEMLKMSHEKHAALQDQYLSLRSEITTMQYDLAA